MMNVRKVSRCDNMYAHFYSMNSRLGTLTLIRNVTWRHVDVVVVFT